MAHFYPKRERERAVWLYNAILRQRGGIGRWLRRNMRRRKILGKWARYSNCCWYFVIIIRRCFRCCCYRLEDTLIDFQVRGNKRPWEGAKTWRSSNGSKVRILHYYQMKTDEVSKCRGTWTEYLSECQCKILMSVQHFDCRADSFSPGPKYQWDVSFKKSTSN